MTGRERWSGRLVLAVAGLALAYGTIWVLAPFVPALATAAVIAVVVYPLHARLRRHLTQRAAAGFVCAAVCVALVLPLSLGAWYLGRESVRAYPLLRESLERLPGVSGAASPAWLPAPARDYLRDLDVRAVLLENLREIGTWSGRLARWTVANAVALAADAVVFVLWLFLLLRDGRETLGRLRAALPPEWESKHRFLERARDMVIATAQGVFAVAILQGFLSMLGFALFGVPFPLLLGGLCMAFSPVPLAGPALVWIPVVARVAVGGALGKAALLAAWFALIVGTLDNVVRPLLVGARSRLRVAVVVVGALGGLKSFGALGAFLGPVILAVAAAVLDAALPSRGHEGA